jgi:hypothetical protein
VPAPALAPEATTGGWSCGQGDGASAARQAGPSVRVMASRRGDLVALVPTGTAHAVSVGYATVGGDAASHGAALADVGSVHGHEGFGWIWVRGPRFRPGRGRLVALVSWRW